MFSAANARPFLSARVFPAAVFLLVQVINDFMHRPELMRVPLFALA